MTLRERVEVALNKVRPSLFRRMEVTSNWWMLGRMVW